VTCCPVGTTGETPQAYASWPSKIFAPTKEEGALMVVAWAKPQMLMILAMMLNFFIFLKCLMPLQRLSNIHARK
jgi:hypothetical protein